MMKRLYLCVMCMSFAWARCTLPLTAPTSVASPVIEVTKHVGVIRPTPTEIVCSTSPGEVTLTVSPVAHPSARVELRGLEPGEKVTIHFFQSDKQRTRQVADYPSEGADQNGVFIVQEGGLRPLPDAVANFWTVKVVHSRGVACAEVTLP